MEIGKRIKELRKHAQLSQTDLAEKLFLSQDTVSLWERGKSLPDILCVIKLAKIFNVTSDYILGIEE